MSISRPTDQQLAIIDKLAEFVARNGPEFEDMTKIKQQNNPKFSFLQQGKEFNEYYQYRVIDERRKFLVMQQQQPQNNSMQNIWSASNNSNGGASSQINITNITTQIEAINSKQLKLKEQIIESEKNLNAQHQVLLQQQKTDQMEVLDKAQLEYITRCAQENEISLTELDDILQPIIASCTKDSIANGKASILQQATNSAKRQIISQYILKKALSANAPFNQKLHLIYLINDLLHHCVKKNADDLKNCLESVVIPMFCNATICANEEQKDKLNKLLNLWASKANFFDSCAISKLQSPPSSLQEYHNSLLSQYASAITPLNQAMKKKFDDYRNQHKAFVEHATNQLTLLEAQKQTLEQQNIQQQSAILNELTSSTQQIIPSIISNVNLLMNQNHEVNMLQSGMYANQNFSKQQQQPHNAPVQQHNVSPIQNAFGQEPQSFQQNFNLPPPSFAIPDFSRPPPGFNNANANTNETTTPNPFPNNEINEEVNLTPTMPYFDLPSGLIVPLIRLEDFSYHGIDPEKIQLPPPSMPTDKLLSAIEAFYSQPSHERPRDNEGWEKLGLYEYFKIKNAVRKQKEEAIMRYEREKSRSPSPIPDILIKPIKKIRKRVYRSQSPDNVSSKSRSTSPETKVIIIKPRKQRSRSPSSPPPYRNPRNSRDSKVDRNRKRSITPPSLPSFSVTSNKSSEFIDEGNKGHLMLKKMGWESGGLGVGNHGITQPISGGEVRDRTDLYKGIGMNMNDPYENFRKNRSNSFITRMKSRSENEKN